MWSSFVVLLLLYRNMARILYWSLSTQPSSPCSIYSSSLVSHPFPPSSSSLQITHHSFTLSLEPPPCCCLLISTLSDSPLPMPVASSLSVDLPLFIIHNYSTLTFSLKPACFTNSYLSRIPPSGQIPQTITQIVSSDLCRFLFLVLPFLFFILCSRLSWLSISFLPYTKYFLSYCIIPA